MTKIAMLATAALLATATIANAGSLGRPCTSAPQNQWLSLDAIDKNGSRVELFVDPTSGAIVGQL
jgi:hypothetical protein